MQHANITTGDILRTARKRAGITQQQLAQQLGITAMSVRRYESGTREPNLPMLTRMSEILNCPLQTLLGSHMPNRSITVCLLSKNPDDTLKQTVAVLTIPEDVSDEQIKDAIRQHSTANEPKATLDGICAQYPGWAYTTEIAVMYADIRPAGQEENFDERT